MTPKAERATLRLACYDWGVESCGDLVKFVLAMRPDRTHAGLRRRTVLFAGRLRRGSCINVECALETLRAKYVTGRWHVARGQRPVAPGYLCAGQPPSRDDAGDLADARDIVFPYLEVLLK